eukprot:241621_1
MCHVLLRSRSGMRLIECLCILQYCLTLLITINLYLTNKFTFFWIFVTIWVLILISGSLLLSLYPQDKIVSIIIFPLVLIVSPVALIGSFFVYLYWIFFADTIRNDDNRVFTFNIHIFICQVFYITNIITINDSYHNNNNEINWTWNDSLLPVSILLHFIIFSGSIWLLYYFDKRYVTPDLKEMYLKLSVLSIDFFCLFLFGILFNINVHLLDNMVLHIF